MLQFIGLGGRLNGRSRTQVDPDEHFKRLLAECGYLIFPVRKERKLRNMTEQMLIFHEDNPTVPLLVYKRKDGTRVVRPFSGSEQFAYLEARLDFLVGTKARPHLVEGAIMKYKGHKGYPWSSWLTEATKRKLRKIGVDI